MLPYMCCTLVSHFNFLEIILLYFRHENNLEVQFNLIYLISSKSLWNDKNHLFILQIQFLLIFFSAAFLLPLFRSFNFLNFC